MVEYLLEFHWWYILIAIVIFFIFFGESKGGVVTHRFSADFSAIDDRFSKCIGYSSRSFFKNMKDESFKVEIDKIPLEKGEELEIYINDVFFRLSKVKGNREIEFDIWLDDKKEEEFPKVMPNDKITVFYNKTPILEGVYSEKE